MGGVTWVGWMAPDLNLCEAGGVGEGWVGSVGVGCVDGGGSQPLHTQLHLMVPGLMPPPPPAGQPTHLHLALPLPQPGSELPPGLLTVVETLPGLVVTSDQTEALLRGYWPSYNIPFHPEICERGPVRLGGLVLTPSDYHSLSRHVGCAVCAWPASG